MKILRLCHVVAMVLVLASCGSDGDGGSAAPDPTPETSSTTAPVVSGPPIDLPVSASDLSRVCTSGEGFGGLAPYEQGGSGPHPVILLLEDDGGLLLEPNIDAIRDWTVGRNEIVRAELVACGTLAERTPNGGSCEFEGTDGSALSLQLVDVVYDVDVLAAATGESVGSGRIEASGTECPTGLLHDYEEGQTDFLNVLLLDFDDAAVAALLEPYVAP